MPCLGSFCLYPPLDLQKSRPSDGLIRRLFTFGHNTTTAAAVAFGLRQQQTAKLSTGYAVHRQTNTALVERGKPGRVPLPANADSYLGTAGQGRSFLPCIDKIGLEFWSLSLAGCHVLQWNRPRDTLLVIASGPRTKGTLQVSFPCAYILLSIISWQHSSSVNWRHTTRPLSAVP